MDALIRAEVAQLREPGWTQAEIADELGLSNDGGAGGPDASDNHQGR
jgi:orotate phosphoribosyltransferase-like protein